MTVDSVIGADPGVTTGVCFAEYENGLLVGRMILQVEGARVVSLLDAQIRYLNAEIPIIGRRVASVEAWEEGPAAGRGKPGRVTRQLVMEIAEALQANGYFVRTRRAADVKPWASDGRLVKGGLADDETALHGKLRDGYDAARQVLFAAHEHGITTDPLIRKRET